MGTHPELEEYARRPHEKIRRLIKEGKIKDLVGAANLLLHALMLERTKVICVSEGMTMEQKKNLVFKHAESITHALKMAFEDQKKDAKVGVIDYGGDVLPRVQGSLDREK